MDDMISRQAAISRAVTIPMFGRDIRVVGVSELENLPSAQPEKRTEERTETHACDLISRQEAIDEIGEWIKAFLENGHKESAADARLIQDGIIQLPSAQPVDKDINVPTNDYISRQAAIEALKKQMSDWNDLYNISVRRSIAILEQLPSAQPEIVRCKDCKFYSPMNRETKTGICNLTMHQNFGDNWFCAGAERRPNGFDRKTNGD